MRWKKTNWRAKWRDGSEMEHIEVIKRDCNWDWLLRIEFQCAFSLFMGMWVFISKWTFGLSKVTPHDSILKCNVFFSLSPFVLVIRSRYGRVNEICIEWEKEKSRSGCVNLLVESSSNNRWVCNSNRMHFKWLVFSTIWTVNAWTDVIVNCGCCHSLHSRCDMMWWRR